MFRVSLSELRSCVKVCSGRHGLPSLKSLMVFVHVKHHVYSFSFRAQELCESQGGRIGLSLSLINLMVSVDVKQH